ncbi:hypothetical protein FAM09_29790 [Niastella caeni]|uniref:Uncharacterized protein n=1 Tax=Niastella caeni TaxID=2569763 RepID=A0A4S8H8C2_9BACT|nr:hypothetical protein [Niastella caeni]THU30795.1 hypothetical protein FAM09_29790 [Niastella caeni]
MRSINSLPVKLTALMMMVGLVKATGQPVTNTFYCFRELMHVQQVLKDTAHVSFDAEYVITFNDATIDTVLYQYKVSGNKVHVTASDSTEFIQNSLYNLLLQHNRHLAVLYKPVELFKYVLHANLTDPSFHESLVSGMAVADTGGYKKLSYNFKPASPYQQYDIIYDSTTYRMHAIQYSFNLNGSGAAPSGSKLPFHVTILFSNYQTGLFTDSVFSTSAYITWSKGNCTMAAPYAGYQLINSLNQ